MKFNTPLIVLDLECTSNQLISEIRPDIQTNDYIIDIGATLVYQDSNGDIVLGDSYSSLVRPGETITPFITQLTGITNEMVSKERLWPEVAKEFEEWVREASDNIKNVRLCAWGTPFDIPVLRKTYEKYDLKYPFSGTSIDAKTICAIYYGLSGKSMRELSVGACAKDFGIEPDGNYHRAATDALVTAEILIKCLNDLAAGHFVKVKHGTPYRYLTIK